jgi:hypothetical protein
MFDTHEIAWAAGLFDGEGHTRANDAQKGSVPILSISQIDRGVLDRFRSAVVGLGTVHGPYGPYTSSTKNAKPHYVFRTSNYEHTQAVIALLWKYLSAVKRAQILGVLRRKRVEHLAA